MMVEEYFKTEYLDLLRIAEKFEMSKKIKIYEDEPLEDMGLELDLSGFNDESTSEQREEEQRKLEILRQKNTRSQPQKKRTY